MSTFSQMRSKIADDLNRTDLTTQINRAINRALTYYKKQRFWFNEGTATFSTVVDQESYGSADGVATDIVDIDEAKITISSTVKPTLTKQTFNYIQQMNYGNFKSQPTDYAIFQNKIWLYPIPNQVWTITLYYQKSYSDLSDDSDENDFTTYAEDLIEARAIWWLFKTVIRDKDAAEDYKQVEMDALTSLQAQTTKLTSSNKLRPTEF